MKEEARNPIEKETWIRLVLVLAFLLPLVVLFFLPGGAFFFGLIWFWLLVVVCFSLIWLVIGKPGQGDATPVQPRMLFESEQPEPIKEIMDVRVAVEEGGVRSFRGRLREAAGVAYDKLKASCSPDTVPLLQEDKQLGAAVLLVPKSVEATTMEKRSRPRIHWLLFALTVITTTWAGAAYQGISLLREPARFIEGLPYSIGLLAILGVHELGHYYAARRHGIKVTPPFFIPVPFALGTFGAFIQMRSPTENRRALFDVAIAGPLAGLAIAIPALIIGLQSSTVVTGNIPPQLIGGTSVNSSILLALIAKISLGGNLAYGHVLRLSPLAFAGWLGLFITALNLLPIGQLDGGHAVRAIFGSRIGKAISAIAMGLLFFLALFVWPGLMLWAFIVFFIAGHATPPLNDLTPLTPGRKALGYLSFAILALILLPLPRAFWTSSALTCPYL